MLLSLFTRPNTMPSHAFLTSIVFFPLYFHFCVSSSFSSFPLPFHLHNFEMLSKLMRTKIKPKVYKLGGSTSIFFCGSTSKNILKITKISSYYKLDHLVVLIHF